MTPAGTTSPPHPSRPSVSVFERSEPRCSVGQGGSAQGQPQDRPPYRAALRDNDIAAGKFNHYMPADYFFANKATLLAKLDDATLERAEKLFARINALLP